MPEKEMLEKIEMLEKRIATLEKEIAQIEEDIYEYVEDDEECQGHCSGCCGCDEDK